MRKTYQPWSRMGNVSRARAALGARRGAPSRRGSALPRARRSPLRRGRPLAPRRRLLEQRQRQRQGGGQDDGGADDVDAEACDHRILHGTTLVPRKGREPGSALLRAAPPRREGTPRTLLAEASSPRELRVAVGIIGDRHRVAVASRGALSGQVGGAPRARLAERTP